MQFQRSSFTFEQPPFSMAQALQFSLICFFVALFIFLPGNGNHALWDRDEARFSEATREMIETGDWIIPHFNGEIRYDKPVLIYWLMSVPMRLFGVNEFSARLPASLAGACTAAFIFFLALRMGFGLAGAVMSSLFAVFSVLFFLISQAATTDAVMTCTVMGAMLLHWERLRHGFRWWKHLLFYALLALCGLVKGPPGLAVVALAIWSERIWRYAFAGSQFDVLEESRSQQPFHTLQPWAFFVIRTIPGLLVFCLIGLPWAIAAWTRTDGGFFAVAVGHHVVNRSKEVFEGHGGPIVYYFALLPVLAFPFTALLINGLRWGIARRHEAVFRFLWCWLVPGLVLFSLVKTKLPHYMAPMMPAVALLIGAWWAEVYRQRNYAVNTREKYVLRPRWWRAGSVLMLLFSLAGPALPIAWKVMQLPSPGFFPALLVGVTMFLTAAIGAIYWWAQRARRAVFFWVPGMVVVYIVLLFWALPAIDSYRPARALGTWLRENAPPETYLMAAVYKEPSITFYGHTHMEEMGKGHFERGLDRLSDTSRPAALIINVEYWRKWQKKYGKPLPEEVTVRFQKDLYPFEQGEWLDLLIVGNW